MTGAGCNGTPPRLTGDFNSTVSTPSQSMSVLVFLLACLTVALCCVWYKKKKDEYRSEKTDIQVENSEEHHGHCSASPGAAPGDGGTHAVVLTIGNHVQVHHGVLQKSRKLVSVGANASCSAVPSGTSPAPGMLLTKKLELVHEFCRKMQLVVVINKRNNGHHLPAQHV